jgi:uncharacterized protein YndB with AHSA1/START domain
MHLSTGKLQVTLPGDCEILVTRELAAPRALVYDAHTKPGMVQRWLHGPDDWEMSRCEIDLRVGGRYRYQWRQLDGAVEFAAGGKFLEIVPGEKIVSTEAFEGPMNMGEATNTLAFSERDGKTIVTLLMRYPTQAIRDAAIKTGMNEGIEMGYARLDAQLAARAAS